MTDFKNSDENAPIWGAGPISKVISKSERATYHLLERGLLPAKKVGGSWVSTPRKLRDALVGDEPV
jgi:hypothetical protein